MDDIFSKVTGFQVDSRKVLPGNAFFALEGEKVNGVGFLSQVACNKGVVAFVPEGYKGGGYGLELVYVKDVLKTLQMGAKKSLNGEKIVGITGSLGKTTTKEFIWQLLRGDFKVDKSPGNQNGQIGIALSILNRDRNADILVLEYGIDEIGGMDSLLEVVKPDIGVLTKVAMVHVSGLGDRASIGREKKKLLFAAREAICPVEWKEGLTSCTSFGVGGDVVIEGEGDRVFLVDNEEKKEINPPFKESHFLEDLMPAYLVAKKLGLKDGVIFSKIKSLKTPDMRFEKVERKGALIIKDMYNASAESMKMALDNLPNPKGKGRVIAVLGDMGELGQLEETLHYEVGEFAKNKVDCLVLLGENASHIKQGFEASSKPCFHFKDKALLCEKLLELVKEDDVVLIKGSRFMKLETVFEKVFNSQ